MRTALLTLSLVFLALITIPATQHVSGAGAPVSKRGCFSRQARADAERTATVYHSPDPGYDPVLGYDPAKGPRPGSPPVDQNGRAKPVACVAAEKPKRITGTLPKFYCTVAGNVDDKGHPVRYKVKPHFKGQSPDKRNGEAYGEFLSSRFSNAVGFYADDEWIADVTCPDCEKSLSKPFQGAKFTPSQTAVDIEMSIGEGIDADCDGDDTASLSGTLSKLEDSHRAEVDAFKLWLAFIDHGDTKKDNQRFACLDVVSGADGSLTCAPGRAIFYVADMGSTFGYSTASEKKARLSLWQGKDPIKISGGRCASTAKDIGDATVGEEGRRLLATQLQNLLDQESQNHVITRVFEASRNSERDQPAAAWTAEFVRKAKTIIDARCSR